MTFHLFVCARAFANQPQFYSSENCIRHVGVLSFEIDTQHSRFDANINEMGREVPQPWKKGWENECLCVRAKVTPLDR